MLTNRRVFDVEFLSGYFSSLPEDMKILRIKLYKVLQPVILHILKITEFYLDGLSLEVSVNGVSLLSMCYNTLSAENLLPRSTFPTGKKKIIFGIIQIYFCSCSQAELLTPI